MNNSLDPMPLGIDGFTYADLYQPSRLRELHEIFCARVAADDPSLWAEWDAYRTVPESVTSPIERSDLIVRMAPHLSRFVTALFNIGDAVGALNQATSRLEPVGKVEDLLLCRDRRCRVADDELSRALFLSRQLVMGWGQRGVL